MTLAATASAIRTALARSADDDELLRLVIQAADDFAAIEHDRESFLAEPPLTSDPRYDALLAGLAVYLVQQAGIEKTPAWTRHESRYLDRMWWVGLPENSGRRAYVLQRTPAYFKARGVLFNVANLESV